MTKRARWIDEASRRQAEAAGEVMIPGRRVLILGVGARSFQWPGVERDGFSTETWGINAAPTMYREGEWFERWYHLHGESHTPAFDKEQMLRSIRAGATKVYTPRGWLPGSIAFPYDEVLREFGSYFNNSLPLVVAHAILEGVEYLTLDGVQYGPDARREAWAVPCIEHMLGVAAGRGLKVTTPPGSGIFEWNEHVYGLTGPGSW